MSSGLEREKPEKKWYTTRGFPRRPGCGIFLRNCSKPSPKRGVTGGMTAGYILKMMVYHLPDGLAPILGYRRTLLKRRKSAEKSLIYRQSRFVGAEREEAPRLPEIRLEK